MSAGLWAAVESAGRMGLSSRCPVIVRADRRR